MENEYGTKEEQAAAEQAAILHFRDGRDKYEKIVPDLIDAYNKPLPGLSSEESLGAFVRGIAKNNFYYGYIYGLRNASVDKL